jgi:methionyl-tRNA formyltransferase
MRIGVIGNDQMLLSCLQYLQQREGAEVCFVYYDPERLNPMNPIDVYCRENNLPAKGIRKLHTPEHVDYIRSCQPDVILSINNFWVIRQEILDIPSFTTVNFHNSVPDRYHGLNIPSWVIMNGEKEHGAMWHLVEQGIDTGDVLMYASFPVTQRDTAATLMVKCIRKGIEMFPAVMDQLFSGQLTRIPQHTGASYYGKKDYPENGGYINFTLSCGEIDRLVRGLNYMPFANPFLYARIRCNGNEVIVNAVETDEEATGFSAGTVVSIDEDELKIQCADGLITIADAMDEEQEECIGSRLAEKLGIRVGDRING